MQSGIFSSMLAGHTRHKCRQIIVSIFKITAKTTNIFSRTEVGVDSAWGIQQRLFKISEMSRDSQNVMCENSVLCKFNSSLDPV